MTEAHMRKQLAQGYYPKALDWESNQQLFSHKSSTLTITPAGHITVM